ncbi:HAMP domain-containing sensor histidine kinase [Pseudoalteromonas sp. OANN1]|uniref:sensor histidine kinase n=1 Tax=Pseudoalteromonas sp. OANN1 TaxID=2954497 RepID=UPI002097EE11|nr:HAMP domain-containing sensor histidine kinase [Pseudoalteromonas sp. OANN1]MCO7198900.1 HAMP domain-containing histidine kinase [Pseudoalteromonas sp. OANN1]
MAKLASLEHKLLVGFAIPISTLTMLALGMICYFELTLLSAITLLLGVMIPSVFALSYGYRAVMQVLENLAVQLDGVTNEEFGVWQLAQYRKGRVELLKAELKEAAKRLQQKRQEYGQNEAFVFNFMSELTLPIVVLDAHHHVYFANHAMNTVYPEQVLHGAHAKALALQYVDEQWQHTQHISRFSIAAHKLYRGQRAYQLLVFFSVEQALRDNEKQVWQKLLSVLNHEVRNALTPVYSMAQSLQQDGNIISPEMQQTMLGVIESRAAHLQQFVANYAQVAQLPPVDMQNIEVELLVSRWQALFPSVEIKALNKGLVYCDEAQLTQAMINLVNNAEQANQSAGNDGITLTIDRPKNWRFTLEDNGAGIANPDNLFVPFYSTKPNGSGIGLVLSRELIRNQQGELHLANLSDNKGAQAVVTLLSR